MASCLSSSIRRSILRCAATTRRASTSGRGTSSCTGTTTTTSATRSYSRTLEHVKEENYFSYQYPLATEPPEITRTQASEVSNDDHARPSSAPFKEGAPKIGQDRFDRTGLSTFEIQQIREAQQRLLPKQLSPNLTNLDSIPDYVPPVIFCPGPASLATHLTTLDNGIRVVSKELSSSLIACTVGVVSDVGSRNEIHPQQRGVVNLLQILSFGSPTPLFPDPASYLAVELGGAAHICTSGREQSLHLIDLLRPHVDDAFLLLEQVLLEPEWSDEAIEGAKQAMGFQAMNIVPEILLEEALHAAAYGVDQQVGQPHYMVQENPELNAQIVREFWQSRFVNNPHHICVVGVGVEHPWLVELAERHFGHLKQVTPPKGSADSVPSVYRGGRVCIEHETKDDLVSVGLALNVEGWHSKDIVPTCVLQTLLGGGSSFSAGGPGKGMYSRIYRQILNKYTWAESAEAFGAFYHEGGMLGLCGSTKPEHVRDMIQVLAGHLLRLAKEPVTQEELDRARLMLQGRVMSQLESRLVCLEDIGRQVLTFGHTEEESQIYEKIQAVTAEDLLRVAHNAIQAGPPSVAAVGPGAESKLPSHEEIASWFQKGFVSGKQYIK